MPDKYVKLNDGRYIRFDEGATKDYMRSTILKVSPNEFGAPPKPQEGLWDKIKDFGRSLEDPSMLKQIPSVEQMTTPSLSPQFKATPTGQAVEKAKGFIEKPLATMPELPKEGVDALPPVNVGPYPVPGPTAYAAMKTAAGMTSPENIGLLLSLPFAPENISKLAGGIFAGQQAQQTVQQGTQAVKDRSIEEGSEALLSASMLGLGFQNHEKSDSRPPASSRLNDLAGDLSGSKQVQGSEGQPATSDALKPNLNRFNTAQEQAKARRAAAMRGGGPGVSLEMPNPKPAPEDVAGAIAHLPEDTTFQNQTSAIAKKFNVSNPVAEDLLREHNARGVESTRTPPPAEPVTPPTLAPEEVTPESKPEPTTTAAPTPKQEARTPAKPKSIAPPGGQAIGSVQRIVEGIPDDESRVKAIADKLPIGPEAAQRLYDRVKPFLPKEEAQAPTRPETPQVPTPEQAVQSVMAQPAMTDRTSQIEDQIRPRVGKLIRLKDLLTGNRAAQSIQDAKEATFDPNVKAMDSETKLKMSQLLKEDVGDKLTAAQVSRLDMMLGREKSDKPQLQRMIGFKIKNPDMQAKLAEARQRMIEDFNSTDDPDLKAKLKKALEPDENGKPQPFLYQPKASYPSPVDLAKDHPEYPFAPKGYPAKIAPISADNLEAALGKRPRTLDLGRMTPEEKAQLTATEKPTSKERGKSDAEKLTDLYNEWAVAHERAQATPDTLPKAIDSLMPEDQQAFKDYVFGEKSRPEISLAEAQESGFGTTAGQQRVASPEQRRLRNSIYENAVRKEMLDTRKELKALAARWNLETSKGSGSLLRTQLDKLDSLTKRALPEELYEKESTPAEASKAPSAAKPKEPTPAPAKTERATTPEATPVKGLDQKIAALSEKIEDRFPDHVEGISNIFESALTTHKDEASQMKFIHAALKTYADGLEKEDELALKRAIDVIKRKGELGAIGDTNIYTQAELQQMAGERANSILLRYENMTPLGLAQYKESLWAPDLRKMVIESSDPVMEARHRALLDQIPQSNSPANFLRAIFEKHQQAETAKGVIRSATGTWHRNNLILQHATASFDQLMNDLSIGESMRFMDHMEMGIGQINGLFDSLRPGFLEDWEKINGSVPHPDEIATAIRGGLDRARNDLTTETDKLSEYIQNYLPHIFVNVGKATDFAKTWVTRRPLEGSTGFLRHREYEFIKDATTEGGLQLVTYNPVRLSLLRIAQLDRYTMAHKIKNGFVEKGLAQHYNLGQQPQGWIPLNDNMFEPKSYSEEEGGMINRGKYYAPENVAKVFNNFVSNGLAGRGKIPYTNFSLYDAIRGYGNLANQFELSLSLFHGAETLVNSAITDASLALKEGVNEGKIVSPSARLLRASSLFAPVVRHTYYGSHMIAEIKDPGTYLNMVQAAKDFETAGGRVGVDPLFRTHQVEALKRNWKIATDELRPAFDRMKAGGKLIPNIAGSVIETTAYPLMNALIPRVKAGVFFDLARQIRSEYEGQSEDIISGELQKAWDSVDNRFGEVVYDNLFMNRVMKDSLSLAMRSPAWNIGTARELGGGIFDAGRSIAQAATRRERIKITNRTAYTLALVGTTAYINALYQHLHPHAPPPHGLDYFYPQDGTKNSNGEANRVYPKLYTYDAINFYKHPASTLMHKAAPLVSGLLELYNNSDYFGREIVDPNDPFPQRMASITNYAMKQFEPFSFSNWQERQLRSNRQSGSALGESLVGILPAPKWVAQSKAEQAAYGYFLSHQSQGPEDPTDFERKREFLQLRNDIEGGKITGQEINDAITSGKLKPKQLQYIFKTHNQSNLQRWVPQLTTVQAFKVWDQADDAEKQQLLPIVFKKAASEGPKEQQVYVQKIESFMKSRRQP